ADPRRGAGGDGRAPARLRAADAGARPAGARRARAGPQPRPPPGARAAPLALPGRATRRRRRARHAVGRAGPARRRGRGRPPGGRGRRRAGRRLPPRRRRRRPGAGRAGGRGQRRQAQRRARGVGLRRGRRGRRRGVRARPGPGLRPRHGRRRPAGHRRVDRQPDGPPRRRRRGAERARRGHRGEPAGGPGPGGGVVTAASGGAGTATGPVRVFLVDDHRLFLAGVRAELSGREDVDIEIVGDAVDVESAVEGIRATRPDVVLLDVHLPGGGGQAVIEAVRPGLPEVLFLALSVSDAAEDVIAVIRAGARGYVTKTISPDELAAAIVRVRDGDAVFSPRLA